MQIMKGSVKDREKKLDSLEVDEEIAQKEANIAQLKAVKAELKRRYGRHWGKYLKIHPNTASLTDLYAVDPSLRDLFKPRMSRGY